MIPSRATLGLLFLWAIVGAAAPFWGWGRDVWLLSGAGIAVLLASDAVWLRRCAGPLIERTAEAACALGARSQIRLRLTHGGRRPQRLQVHDRVPPAFEWQELPQQLRVLPGAWAEVSYTVRAVRRGEWCFGKVDYRLCSPLGLWWQRRAGASEQTVRIFPDFQAVARYTLLARDDRLRQIGIHARQRRGEGRDFFQLRDYRIGDAMRQIDWRATSRLQKAISREFRDERDQRVVFMLDHGRRMHSKDGELSHLDHALNAVLLLAYVALRQGDAVGLLTFGGESRWIAPKKGLGFLNTLQNAIFDLESSPFASDLNGAVEEVMTRLSRRSLLVLITNLRDDADLDTVAMIRMLQRRHLVLLASMRERALTDTLAQEPKTFRQALTTAALHHYLRYREDAHRRLTRTGAYCLDAEPHRLPLLLVNRYLDIKQAGAL